MLKRKFEYDQYIPRTVKFCAQFLCIYAQNLAVQTIKIKITLAMRKDQLDDCNKSAPKLTYKPLFSTTKRLNY
jgi:hypothetical protein